MWSRGAPNAWFSIDLKYVELCPTHYCYRGDAGGGENHPRTWKLQGPATGPPGPAAEHKHDHTVQMHTVGSFPSRPMDSSTAAFASRTVVRRTTCAAAASSSTGPSGRCRPYRSPQWWALMLT